MNFKEYIDKDIEENKILLDLLPMNTEARVRKYKETVDEDAKKVQLFNSDYFTSLMWQSKDVNLPHLNSFWALDESRSAPKEKVFVFEKPFFHYKC